jgi:hypothetical protein
MSSIDISSRAGSKRNHRYCFVRIIFGLTVSLQRRQICCRWGTPAYWSLVPGSSMFYRFEFCLKNMWNCSLSQQILSHSFYGIPMGATCAPLLADLLLCSYQSEFLQKHVKDKRIHEARAFNFTYRYTCFTVLNFVWKICGIVAYHNKFWAIVSMTESVVNCFF